MLERSSTKRANISFLQPVCALQTINRSQFKSMLWLICTQNLEYFIFEPFYIGDKSVQFGSGIRTGSFSNDQKEVGFQIV